MPARSASANVGRPTGMTMNSWRSTLLSAWAPPFRMFIIGTGSRYWPSSIAGAAQMREVRVQRLPRGRRGARTAAIDTPSSALAPRRLLVGVPSSAISC